MEILEKILQQLKGLLPTAIVVVVGVLFIAAVRWVMTRRFAASSGHKFRMQMVVLLLSFCALLAVILSLPVSESTVGQLLSLLGILLSAAIALSATTFVGNIMAGLMLRAVKNFRGGDFVRVGDYFGRVSERGLFHIEVQTEDRDLITLPNLYLVTNPVRVVRPSGTLVTAEVSLGYDVDRAVVTEQLTQAAEEAGLTEPFVQIRELGDFSVTYRAAGLLSEVRSLLSTRSKLMERMMDRLHAAGVEIVSPTFMNQRPAPVDRPVRPAAVAKPSVEDSSRELPEDVVFDKADEAESLEKLRERLDQLRQDLESARKTTESGEAPAGEVSVDRLQARIKALQEYIDSREKAEK